MHLVFFLADEYGKKLVVDDVLVLRYVDPPSLLKSVHKKTIN